MEPLRRPLSAVLQLAAALAFAAVWGWLALHGLPGGMTAPLDLSRFAHPFGALSLLTFSVAALALAKVSMMAWRWSRSGRVSDPTALPFGLALAAGSLWPFVLNTAPALAAAMVGLQLLLALTALGQSDDEWRRRRLRLGQMSGASARLRLLRIAPVAVFAGWSIAVGGSLLSVLIQDQFGFSPVLATVLGLVAIAALAVVAQLAAARTPELSLAVIWALIGTAASQIGTDLPATLMAVAGVSLLAAGIVQVTS